ncbi:hypothetical protein SAZ11_04470 [Streptomyces sp. FXJ1.4098]|nr:hypothetical protein [Streptomyces sp. FXJ1.4098]
MLDGRRPSGSSSADSPGIHIRATTSLSSTTGDITAQGHLGQLAVDVSRPLQQRVLLAQRVVELSRSSAHAMLGVVSGRRCMGKTYLLRALIEQLGGFCFGATTATEVESRRQFGAALAEPTGSLVPFSFDTWDDAIERVLEASSGVCRSTRHRPLFAAMPVAPADKPRDHTLGRSGVD